MTANQTADALDEFLGGFPKPKPDPITGLASPERLCVFNDGKHWKASYRTATGFLHVKLGTQTSITSKAAAEARADELEAR